MTRPRRQTLSTFIMRRILLCVLPLVLLATWLTHVKVTDQEKAWGREATSLANNFSATIDQYLRARIRGLHMLGVSPLLDDPRRWPELYREAQGFQESFGSHVILARANEPRQMLFNTRVPLGTKLPPLPHPKGHAAAPAAVSTGKPAVGDTFIGPIAKEPLVAIAVPVRRGGSIPLVMLTTFEASAFKKQLDRVTLPPGWALTLYDGRGEVIAKRSPPGLDKKHDAEPASRFTARSNDSPWTVAVDIPRTVYRTPLFIATTVLGAGLLGATLIAIMGGVLVGRQLGRAVSGLASPAEDTPGSIIEIEAARQVLQQATMGVRESEQRFRRLFQEATMPLCYVNKHGVIQDRNRWFVKVFGYTEADVATAADWWLRAYPDPTYRAWAQSTWDAAIARASETSTDIEPIEYRVTCKDGTERIMLISGISLGEDLLATFTDLTEYKRAEKKLADALAEQKRARLATLNQMEDAIAAREEAETAREDLRLANASLEQRVDQRTAELQAANKELDAFAYAVSHDLRAPLRAMLGFSQALQEDYAGKLDSEALDYLQEIQIASRSMASLVDGLLTLSRSTRGKLLREPFDVVAATTRIREELELAEPGRLVTWQIETGLQAYGDGQMLEVVMRNLLANAWKYTARAKAPLIRVFREAQGGRHCICVADNGAGFDMRHADRLFKPFQRLHRQDEFPGIGIGLATVQRIIHRHGGDIEAESIPGEGATFRFFVNLTSETGEGDGNELHQDDSIG